MSKRLIASIKNNIERLDEKIAASRKDISLWELQREKYFEMLKLAEPHQPAPAPEVGKTVVPAFLKKHHEGETA